MSKKETEVQKREKLQCMSVRFTPGAMSAIGDIAARHNMTKAEIVRITVDNRLSSYLSNLVYLDDKKAKRIEKKVTELGTTLDKIRLELNRIGVNYNQEIRLKNIERKYAKKSGDYDALKRKKLEEAEVKNDSLQISNEDLDEILREYDRALEDAKVVLEKLIK